MHSRLLIWGAQLCVMCAIVAASPMAHAQDDKSDMADKLFEDGRALMKEGKWSEACPKLAESNRLDPNLGTLLNLAVCHERDGKLAAAYGKYRELEAGAAAKDETDRAEYARKKIDALEGKISHVVIFFIVPPPEGVTVKLDGAVLDAAALGLPIAVDLKSRHHVEVSAAGRRTWSSVVNVPADKRIVRVKIPELQPFVDGQDAKPPIVPSPAPAPAAAGDAAPVGEMASVQPEGDLAWLAWTGFAVGGAGLAIGAITGGLSLSRSGDVLDQCAGNDCPRSLEDDIASAELLANVSNVSFVLAALGAGVGIVALVISPAETSGDADATTWSLRVTPTGASLDLRF